MQVLAEGIQGVFEGHSMGIRVSKRAFSEEHSGKVLKTYGFSTCRDPEIDTELPYYNIRRIENIRRRQEIHVHSRLLEFYSDAVLEVDRELLPGLIRLGTITSIYMEIAGFNPVWLLRGFLMF